MCPSISQDTCLEQSCQVLLLGTTSRRVLMANSSCYNTCRLHICTRFTYFLAFLELSVSRYVYWSCAWRSVDPHHSADYFYSILCYTVGRFPIKSWHLYSLRKEGRFTHPWQPARLIGWNSVWVGQCDISAMTSCQGRL